MHRRSFPTIKAIVRVDGFGGGLGSTCGFGEPNAPFGTVLCTSDGDGRNSRHCNGDSGGFLGGFYRGNWVVVGITSFIGFRCDSQFGYTNVNPFFNWIVNTANRNS